MGVDISFEYFYRARVKVDFTFGKCKAKPDWSFFTFVDAIGSE
jgi:hypothetical protein